MLVNALFISQFRRGHRRRSVKKGVLSNFSKFKGKHLCQCLGQPRPATSLKKETLEQVFSCEFCVIYKGTFFTEHLRTTASNNSIPVTFSGCLIVPKYISIKENSLFILRIGLWKHLLNIWLTLKLTHMTNYSKLLLKKHRQISLPLFASISLTVFWWFTGKLELISLPKFAQLIKRPMLYTAWKVSKYGVISGPYFPVFGLNTAKYGPEMTPYLDTFHAVSSFAGLLELLFKQEQ